MSEIEIAGMLAGGAITLMVYSYLYRENPFYRLAEVIFVGAAVGRQVAIAKNNIINFIITPIGKGEIIYSIALVLGLMYLLFFIRRYRWLYRIPVALLIGSGIGVEFAGSMKVQIVNQMISVLKRGLITGLDPVSAINNLLIIIGVVTTLMLFSFTKEHKGPLGIGARIGRMVLMLNLGYSFGRIVQMRVSVAISRLTSLFIEPTFYIIPVGLAILAFGIFNDIRKGTIRTV